MCGYVGVLQEHHIEFKQMGGRHGEAKNKSESKKNKQRLCLVCHSALHGIRVILIDGHSCDTCLEQSNCEHKQVRNSK